MSKARQLADLGNVYDDGALSNRNVIVNGRFDVWQRSTGPVTNSGYTTVDRWRFPASGITTEQVSNDRDLSIPYALKVTADGTGYGITQTRIEDVRTLSGKDATFSIWVKSPTTGAFRFFIEQNFGSGGSSTVSILDNASQFSIASANTWEQFTVTVTMPSISGKTLGTAHHVSLGIGANSGTANRVMYYSEAQLEVGDTGTPFEHEPHSVTLQKCRRYYYQKNWTSYYEQVFMPTWCNSTNSQEVIFYHPVEMRASPSCSHNGVGNFRVNNSKGQDETCSNITFKSPRTDSALANFEKSTANFTVGDAGYINTEANNDASFYIDAEL